MIVLPPSDYFSKTQGLVITYKNKTYRVDFEKILIENGAGYVEKNRFFGTVQTLYTEQTLL